MNDAPVAVNDTASGDEDTVVTGDVEANDTDVDGDALTVTQFVVGTSTVTVDPVTGGSITLAEGDLTINADGSFTFTPVANFNGSVPQVTYTITDGSLSDTATLDITINPVNDAPVAVNDTASGDEDTVVTGDVEANDTDVDGDALTVTQFVVGTSTVTVDPVTGGSITLADGDLTINADGSFTFTPVANFNGSVPQV
ncbi:MAG: Ig-like domain-containing protein, partial [Pseudomonadota bacterium]